MSKSNPWLFSLFFIRVKTLPLLKKRYAEIGFPCRAPLFNWKYWVVFPLLVTQDFDLFKMTSIQLIINEFVPKPIFLSTTRSKEWFNGSNVFLISIVAKKPLILKTSLTSMISDINLHVSQINLPLT